jgi:DNA-binding PucR family transcriptional regulator
VRVFDPSPLAALMAREPAEGERLAREVLGGLLALPDDDRGQLLETLHAYLDHAGSAEQAATVLHCHPNTVRYRLRRIHELTGRSLSDPHGLAELAAASYSVRMRTEPNPSGSRRTTGPGQPGA